MYSASRLKTLSPESGYISLCYVRAVDRFVAGESLPADKTRKPVRDGLRTDIGKELNTVFI